MSINNLGESGLSLLGGGNLKPQTLSAGLLLTSRETSSEWAVKITCPKGHNFNSVVRAGVKAKAGVPEELVRLLPGFMDKTFAAVPEPDFENLEEHLKIPSNERTNMGDMGSQGDIEVSILPGNRFKVSIVALLTTEMCPSKDGIKGGVKEAMGRLLGNTRWGRGAFEIEVHDQFTKMAEVLGCNSDRNSIAVALTKKHGDEKALQIMKAITFNGSWISDTSKEKIGNIVNKAKDGQIPHTLMDALIKMGARSKGL